MAYAPIANILPQYEDYAAWWMKGYEQGTSTPLAMATDVTGGTTLAKAEIDAQGFPETTGSARFIPFMNAAFDMFLFPTEAEADANDTTNAIQISDNIDPSVVSGITLKVSSNDTTPGYLNGKLIAGTNIGLTEGSDGGDETFSIAVVAAPAFAGTVKFSKGNDIASATALTIPADGNYFDVTGTTAITSINTVGIGTVVKLHFDAALILTHHATDLILPSGDDITTVAGDEAEFIEYATGDWRCTNYQRTSSALLGKVVQIVHVQDGAVATGTTTLPLDDTTPQNTEGDEYITLAITPTKSTNKLKIDAVLNLSHSAGSGAYMSAALFQDSTANALAAAWGGREAAVAGQSQVTLTHYMTAGTTSATTFKIRAGTGIAGTTTFNGAVGAQYYNGLFASTMTITEIEA